MDIERLQELIRVFENSSLWEIEIEESGRRVCLKKGQPAAIGPAVQPAPYPQALAPAQQMHPQPQAEAAPQGGAAETAAGKGATTINSPMVGVFYSSPAPGEEPFVKPGDTVSENQTVCIVEAMKLMNEVTAKFAATIEKVLVENGEPVEYGQPLFAVRALE